MRFFLILISIGLMSFVFASEARIINGNRVSDNDPTWRFIVALEKEQSQYCAGSLIAPTWVLTAAHCLYDEYGTPITPDYRYGVGAKSYDLADMQEHGIKRFIVHPNYNPMTNDNDIGLVELTRPVEGVTPIIYDRSHPLSPGTPTKVAGWGNMSRYFYFFPSLLQEALAPIIDRAVCNAPSSYGGAVTSNMLCAGYMDGRRDSCQGDSGGPLIVDGTLVGIVSWGEGCGLENYPGVYTKVQNYASWIESYLPDVPLWVPIFSNDIVMMVPYFRF